MHAPLSVKVGFISVPKTGVPKTGVPTIFNEGGRSVGKITVRSLLTRLFQESTNLLPVLGTSPNDAGMIRIWIQFGSMNKNFKIVHTCIIHPSYQNLY